MSIKHLLYRFLVLIAIGAILLCFDYSLMKKGRSQYFKTTKLPYGVKPLNFSRNIKLLIDANDMIIAGNYLRITDIDSSVGNSTIERIYEYIYSKDSLIIKYLADDNSIYFMKLVQLGTEIGFQRITEEEFILSKTSMITESFDYEATLPTSFLLFVIWSIIFLLIFIYLFIFIITNKKIFPHIFFAIFMILVIYFHIDYKGAFNFANISIYHRFHPNSVIRDTDIEKTRITPSKYTKPIDWPNHILYGINRMVDSCFFFSYSFLNKGVVAQYYDINKKEIRYAYIESYPAEQTKYPGYKKIHNRVEDIFITLVLGKHYYINITPIEEHKAKKLLNSSHTTTWVNQTHFQFAYVSRNISKFILKIFLFLCTIKCIKRSYHHLKREKKWL